MAKIIVVDDDEQICGLFKDILEEEGHEVRTANDGLKAIELFKADASDLILTDIYMPDKEGIETILELKSQQPDVRIIAISGGGQLGAEFQLDIAERVGALKTLRKPIRKRELIEAVNEVLLK